MAAIAILLKNRLNVFGEINGARRRRRKFRGNSLSGCDTVRKNNESHDHREKSDWKIHNAKSNVVISLHGCQIMPHTKAVVYAQIASLSNAPGPAPKSSTMFTDFPSISICQNRQVAREFFSAAFLLPLPTTEEWGEDRG